jgi:plasmid stabilization system protein ParE
MMVHRVVISRRAERDLQAAARWWASERSAEQASRWLSGLDEKLQSLSEIAASCSLAAENSRFPFELREVHYGAGKRATHRAVFSIAGDLVLVLAVRHLAQDRLRPEDFT